MKKLVLLICLIFTQAISFAQEISGIKISNEKRNEQIFIKNKARIELKTRKGVKISGRYKIIDAENIIIKGQKLHINNIRKIKKNPLGASIATTSICFIGSAVVAAGSIVSSKVSGRKNRLVGLAPAALLAYTGIKSPNILKGYRKSGWKFEIVGVPQKKEKKKPLAKLKQSLNL